ncbi:hypothetical protein HBB16_20455 [Pseudonocardia sp. MCCB 268]|nr:hypothetical protein [Pseudonocardia cytotoxica]
MWMSDAALEHHPPGQRRWSRLALLTGAEVVARPEPFYDACSFAAHDPTAAPPRVTCSCTPTRSTTGSRDQGADRPDARDPTSSRS